MTDNPGLSEQRADPFCLCCCRPRSAHLKRDLQCPETTYFIANEAAFAQPPASGVDRSRDGHTLDETGYNCSCHARFSTRWEAAEHAGISHGGPLAALTNSGAPVPGDGGLRAALAARLASDAAAIDHARKTSGQVESYLAALAYRVEAHLPDILAALAHAAPAPSDGAGVPAGMVPWGGGDSAPADWDGGPVWLRYGKLWTPMQPLIWGRPYADRGAPWNDGDIIAYTPKQATPTDEAVLGEREACAQVARDHAAWEREQAAKPGVGKKAANDHLGAAHACEMVGDAIRTRPAPGSTGETSDV